MHYFLFGSGGYGREAVIRGTCSLLRGYPQIITDRLAEDWYCGLGKLAALESCDADWMVRVEPGDICLAMIDDDCACLKGTASRLRRRGARVVAWNCAVSPRQLGKKAVAALRVCDAVTVPDTASLDALCQAGIRVPIKLCADPAFLLESIRLPLPEAFREGHTVGISLSAGADTDERLHHFRRLMGHILKNTDLNIALIPCGSRDLRDLSCLHAAYAGSGRVCLIRHADSRVIKGYVARCALYVGTGRQAMIGAWSSGVPAMAVGDGVGLRAIARDLFGGRAGFVLSRLREAQQLIDGFERLRFTAIKTRQRLLEEVPRCRARAAAAREVIDALSGGVCS